MFLPVARGLLASHVSLGPDTTSTGSTLFPLGLARGGTGHHVASFSFASKLRGADGADTSESSFSTSDYGAESPCWPPS